MNRKSFLTLDENNIITPSGTTKTATYSSTGRELGKVNSGKFVFNVTAIDHTTSDETYSIMLEESSDNLNWVELSSFTIDPTSPKEYSKIFETTSNYFRYTLTLAGTTPSITYGSWITNW